LQVATGSRFKRPIASIEQSTDTAEIGAIIVRVQDNSTTAGISCFATSCAGLGDICSETPTKSTGNSETGATFLNLGNLSAFNAGYAYIHCDFPSTTQSKIYSYRATD
jgi:hypothetical protein